MKKNIQIWVSNEKGTKPAIQITSKESQTAQILFKVPKIFKQLLTGVLFVEIKDSPIVM